MIPSITATRMSGAGRDSLPVLVLGPSLGTSSHALWSQCAGDLTGSFDVVAWDLPGHGHNRSVPEEEFTVAELAAGVLTVVDDILDQRGEHDGTFFVAGDSVGGEVALQLLLDQPSRVSAAATLNPARDHGPLSDETAARLLVLDRAAPDQAPAGVARLLTEHFLGPAGRAGRSANGDRDQLTTAEVRAAGMDVRREVLGAAHVDRATANATDLTRDFQEFITEYAWGGIWTRPGLDRRSRSMITLTALVARGHHEELAMHLRAAITNGLSQTEIKELLMQTAIYCGVPDANTAFRIAQQVFAEE